MLDRRVRLWRVCVCGSRAAWARVTFLHEVIHSTIRLRYTNCICSGDRELFGLLPA